MNAITEATSLAFREAVGTQIVPEGRRTTSTPSNLCTDNFHARGQMPHALYDIVTIWTHGSVQSGRTDPCYQCVHNAYNVDDPEACLPALRRQLALHSTGNILDHLDAARTTQHIR